MQQWPEQFINKSDPGIEFLELYALTSALLLWRRDLKLSNARVTIYCDNESVVHMVNKLTSSCKQCMKLIRIIALEAITWNRKVLVRHVRTEDNYLADSLSCLKLKRFFQLASNNVNAVGENVTSVPIWPMKLFWKDETNYLCKL